MLKRELCEEHAKNLRTANLFGGKPTEEKIPQSNQLPCGIETMLLYGKTSTKRVQTCDKQATSRFIFERIIPIETIDPQI